MRPRLEARDAVWYNHPDQLAALLDAGLDVNMPEGASRETLLVMLLRGCAISSRN